MKTANIVAFGSQKIDVGSDAKVSANLPRARVVRGTHQQRSRRETRNFSTGDTGRSVCPGAAPTEALKPGAR